MMYCLKSRGEYEMGIIFVWFVIVFVFAAIPACSQTTQDEVEQAPENCPDGTLVTGTNVNDNLFLSAVGAYEERAQASVITIENASLPINAGGPSLSLRVTNGQRSVDVLPQSGGIRLVPVPRSLLNSTMDNSVFISSPVDCVFTGFHDNVRNFMLGFCVGITADITYLYPLRIFITFDNLTNSQIILLRMSDREELFGIFSNFVYVNNDCLVDEDGHILFIDDGEIVDYSVETGMLIDHDSFQFCSNESRLELVSPKKVAAFCDGETTLIEVCRIDQQSTFSKEEYGRVYFCSENVFVSAKNSTLTLRSVNDRQVFGNVTDFSSSMITYANCSERDGVYHFVATLETGETWYCDLTAGQCQLLGTSEHALGAPSLFVGSQYVILNNGNSTLLYDLFCPANPIVAEINHNFDTTNFYPETFRVPCECTLVITTTELPETTATSTTTSGTLSTTNSALTPKVMPPIDSTSMRDGVIAGIVVPVIAVLFSLVGISILIVIVARKCKKYRYSFPTRTDPESRPLRNDNHTTATQQPNGTTQQPNGTTQPQQLPAGAVAVAEEVIVACSQATSRHCHTAPAYTRPTLPLPLDAEPQPDTDTDDENEFIPMASTDNPLSTSVIVAAQTLYRSMEPQAIIELEDRTSSDQIITHERVTAIRNNEELSRNGESQPDNEQNLINNQQLNVDGPIPDNELQYPNNDQPNRQHSN